MNGTDADLVNGFIGHSVMKPYVWEGGFTPYRVKFAFPCDGCGERLLPNQLVWYSESRFRRCTRCRNREIAGGLSGSRTRAEA